MQFCALLGAESTVGLLTAKSLTQSMFAPTLVAGSSGGGMFIHSSPLSFSLSITNYLLMLALVMKID